MLKIGTTERGDSGLDFSWIDRMPEIDAAILITKSVNDEFIEKILPFKDKVILHATITGFGSKGAVYDSSIKWIEKIEPNVNNALDSINQLKKLISLGFASEHIVYRIDPIIPFENFDISSQFFHLNYAVRDLGVKRIRISFINMYPHVINRFRNADILKYMKYTSFNQPDLVKYEILDYLSTEYPYLEFELCADISDKDYSNIHQIGCVSYKDLSILGINGELQEKDTPNRKGCLCPSNKVELLNKMNPCEHKCLYCFWKD